MALLGMQGAMVQMISHGFVSGAMFTCIGVMYDRMHTRQIKDYGGVINVMPWFGFFYVLFAMANCGLPGTSGFVGEFMVILASFSANPWIALFAAFTLIIGAAYTLWLVKRVLWGDITNPHVAEMKEINGRETFVLAAFAAAVLALGVWPQPLIHLMDTRCRSWCSSSPSTRFDRDPNMPNLNDILIMLPEFYLVAAACLLLLLDAFMKPRAASMAALDFDRRAAGDDLPGDCRSAGALRDGVWRHVRARWVRRSSRSSHWHHRDGVVYARPYLIDRKLFIGEFYTLLIFAVIGVMLLVSAGNSGHPVSGPGAAVAVVVCAGGVEPRCEAAVRSGDQVFRAGRTGLGHAAVRHVDGLWCLRHGRYADAWIWRSCIT
jgi:hypothetical protein